MRSRNRMVVAATTCALLAPSLYAGDLYPPPGPVQPTGRFGPRTEINDTNTPGDATCLFRITQPGSYYLGSNVTGGAGKHGIQITADNVLIDLNGFALLGVEGSLTGIDMPATNLYNITVENGCVRDWGLDGVELSYSLNSQVKDLRVTDNQRDGIHLGRSAVITRCATIENVHDGILVGRSSSVSHCTAASNGEDGFWLGYAVAILNCAAWANTGHGFYSSNGSVQIQSCTALENGAEGIDVGQGSNVRGCTVKDSGADGINAGEGSSVDGCTVLGSGGAGIRACNSLIHGNTSGNNAGPAFDGCGSSTELENHSY